ncbi:LysE family translocator [Streptomyces sp. NPDC094034]|uniref:LysE family translocator n=1 Tax=Streptomyces sp. NPDC094034 TaxID=3155309 RepID=UPI003324FC67
MAIDWPAFVLASLTISVIPGANQLLGLRNAYRRGPRAALLAVGGRLAAFAVMIVLVSAGLGTLLLQSERLFTAIKWTGVVYLLYLGVRILRSSRRVAPGAADDAMTGADSRAPGVWALSREEFVVAGTNPKAVVLFAALLPQFVSGPGPLTAGLLTVGVAYLAVEFAVAIGYTVVGAQLRRASVSARVDRVIQRATGVCLIGFAAYFATGRQPA